MTSFRFISFFCVSFLIFVAMEFYSSNRSEERYQEYLHSIIEEPVTLESQSDSISLAVTSTTTGNPNSNTTSVYNEYQGTKDNQIILKKTLNVMETSYKYLEKIEGSKTRFPTVEEYVKLKNILFSNESYKKYFCMEDLDNIRTEVDIKPIRDYSCNAPLISMNYFGRMGNQISQYLSLLLLHLKYDANIVITSEMEAYLRLLFLHRSIPVIPIYCEEHYNATDTMFKMVFSQLAFFRKESSTEKYQYAYEDTLVPSRIFIRDYPCPVYLFMNHREIMKKELKILPYIQNQAKKMLEEIIPKEFKRSLLVSVHVRRTDYVEHLERHFHKPLTMNYYNRAMNLFRNKTRFGKPLFLIFSDDPEWCKMHFFDRDILVAGNGDQENFLLDFAMIAQCDHHIAGYGTFSFTSAFLSKGLIVYPLPVIPPERVFGVQSDYLCSDSEHLVPIPDLFQFDKNDLAYE